MRIFALSDMHIDFDENNIWLDNLSQYDYKDDILLLAGDITDIRKALVKSLTTLRNKFHDLLFVPGNHDLWVFRNNEKNSLESFAIIQNIVYDCGIYMEPRVYGELTIIPLFGWYDYSFGQPSNDLLNMWSDYTACTWPAGYTENTITRHFIGLNEKVLQIKNLHIITFSHFLPRIDLMPYFIPPGKRLLYPVLGTVLLEKQIRLINPDIHVYGHSHLNMHITLDSILYINNAFGYPSETNISLKQLRCIFEI